MTPATPHLLVFDLDGTLVDSRHDLAVSANEMLADLGGRPLSTEEVVGMVGEGARVLVDRVLRAAGVEADRDAALARFLGAYDRHLTDQTRLYPGISAALDALRGRAALAVLTNKPAHHTGRLLEALGVLGRFAGVVGGDGPFPRKPDPASLLHLMREAGARPETTIMVGDSMVDVETAQRARTRLAVVRYGYGRLDDAALEHAVVIDRPDQLAPRLLDAIESERHGILRD